MAGQAIAQTKVCSKCGVEKPLTGFTKQKGAPKGVRSRCRECLSEDHKANRLRHAERTKLYRERYKERERLRHQKYAKENREKVREANRRYRESNPERHRAYCRRYYAKVSATPRGRLENTVSANMHRGLKSGGKAGRRWESLVGYTIDDLMRHIERQFEPGMTWQNHGAKWHLDHIIPLSAFNYDSPDQIDFKRAWALSNLRPLWKRDNIVKKDKLSAPFQPSLAI